MLPGYGLIPSLSIFFTIILKNIQTFTLSFLYLIFTLVVDISIFYDLDFIIKIKLSYGIIFAKLTRTFRTKQFFKLNVVWCTKSVWGLTAHVLCTKENNVYFPIHCPQTRQRFKLSAFRPTFKNSSLPVTKELEAAQPLMSPLSRWNPLKVFNIHQIKEFANILNSTLKELNCSCANSHSMLHISVS